MADELHDSMGTVMDVEVPIRVSLGRTRIRMKDLLALSHGSVVELDPQVGDEVEIRVSNCLLALGEVVNVDGNYGVRVSRMAAASSSPAPAPAAALPRRAEKQRRVKPPATPAPAPRGPDDPELIEEDP